MITFKKLLFLIAIIFLGHSNSNATHAGMMELTYRHISANTYEFTLVFYRNCQGSTAGAPFAISLRAESASLSLNVPNVVTLNQIPTSGPGIPPLRPPNFFNCTNLQTCFEEYVYRGTLNINNLTSTPYADDWVFSYSLCCIPGGILAPDNIGPGIMPLNAECGLNNLDFPNGNDAPFWHERRPIRPGYTTDTTINYPGISICEGVLNTVDQGVVEYEGDNIKYEFVQPISATSYINGFSLSMPMPFITPPGLNIDSVTGIFEVEGANSTYQVFYLGIKAREFRTDTDTVGGLPIISDKQIGYVYRDLMVILEPAATCPDKSIDLKKNKLNVSCGDSIINVETSKKFKCNTADFDGSLVLLKENISGNTIPIDSVKVNSCFANFIANSFQVYLNSPLPAGEYNLVLKKGSDGNTVISECGSEIPEFIDTIFITVDTVEISKIIGSSDTNGQALPFMVSDCGRTELGIKFDFPVRCNSIDLSGSEFLLVDSTTNPISTKTIVSVTPDKCKKGYTDSLIFVLATPFESGNYELVVKGGSDGNTFLNECGDETLPTSFPILVPDVAIDLGPDLVYCKDSVFYAVLGPQDPFASYDWSTGQSDPQIVVTKEGFYTLEVDNGFGCKARDTVVVTEIDCGTGISEYSNKGFQIAPNPANQSINIIFQSGEETIDRLTIFDLEGKKVVEHKVLNKNRSANISIQLSDIPNGIYLLQLTTLDGQQMSKKLIVNKK